MELGVLAEKWYKATLKFLETFPIPESGAHELAELHHGIWPLELLESRHQAAPQPTW